MRNKSLTSIFYVIFSCVFLFAIASCNFTSDVESASENNQKQYGSLRVNNPKEENNSRYLNVSSINKADVTVSGYGMSENCVKNDVAVTAGIGSCTVENIPVGTNRVVTVEAKQTIENVVNKIEGAVLRNITDITSGDNEVDVTWSTTALGNVYAKLLADEFDITGLSPSEVTALLPDVHSSLVDTESLAEDIENDTTGNSDDYKLNAGSITYKSNIAVSGTYAQVMDPLSSRNLNALTGSTQTITNVAPGTWNFYILNSDDTILYSCRVNVSDGGTSAVNGGEAINIKVPSPRLEDAEGSVITRFITGETRIYLACRTLDGETPLAGTTIYYTTDGSDPTAESLIYTDEGILVSRGSVLKAIGINSDAAILASEISEWTFERPALGEVHPANGNYSPVDMNGAASGFGWSSGTWALGANVDGENTTFALYSANAENVLLEIYNAPYGHDALYDYWMEKDADNVWRAKLSGNLNGAIYAFRVWGPNWSFDSDWERGGSSAGFVSDCDSNGNRFNPNKVVYDPYAREMTHDPSNASAIASYKTTNSSYALASPEYQILSTGETTPTGSSKAWREFDSGTISPKGYIITDSTSYGTKPAIPQKDAIIYEAHVRGITKHSSAAKLSTLLSGYDGFDDVVDIPEEYRGTYKGAALLVPYLKALGINTIELLPVHETDNDANPDDGPGGNFWGYMTFDYFAPDRRYSSDKTAGGPTREFKEMVKTFHDAGMEVYLDVVYNHTGEGGTWHGSSTDANFDSGKQCTVVSMRGIDNQTYYSLVKGTKWSYWETTGCGNNMQCDNSTVRQFILDSLTYWIDEMGVDGFRFDLATTLGREYNSSTGNWNYNSSAATLTQIASLGKTKNAEMIAESWDCGDGSYQVGNFPDGWAGWNGYYRDNIRGFVGNAQAEAAISYTTGLYGDLDHFGVNEPSVNFVVAHDGFTLADLCSYSGSGNYYNDKLSWPFGPSDGGNGDNNSLGTGTDAASRRQRARNYFAMQMFSAGIPMIVYGDELGRTQNGNNNPYNIDSVATWNNYLMAATSTPQGARTYASSGIAQETGTYSNMFGTYANTENKNGQLVFSSFVMNERLNNNSLRQVSGAAAPIEWYKTSGTLGWEDSGNAKAIMINGSKAVDGAKYYMLINMNGYQTNFTVPASSSGYHWVRIVDTGSWAEASFNCWKDSDENAYSFTAATEYGVGSYTVTIFKEVSDAPVTPTCATPSISGDTPFETSTSVTITCSTDGAVIYYTTNGSAPTESSTRYTGAFTITETTTVRAIAVCEGYLNSSATKSFYLRGEITESPKSGVMLQGFNWDSAPRGGAYNAENPSPYWGRWYNVVINNADAISDNFAYMWCPPPSMTDTASSEGYAPTQLNNLNNCYGTETELKTMINAISPTKAIADIVINHRAGTSNWADFTNPRWTDDYYSICSDDECFSSSDSPIKGNSNRGAADTGDGYSAYRDLDHTNTSVQQGIIDWMNNVLKPAGFVGWRYDYVKGYGGKYVGKYNAQTEAEFSVGEYWPTASYSASGWGAAIKNWISATESENGQRSRAFDFALKGAMNSVFNNSGSYAQLADSSNLYISQPADAVTFVDNHDTGSTQGHWPVTSSKVGIAYALILTHPGYPCVAWQHYFTYAESGSTGTDGGAQYLAGNTVAGTSNTLRQHIDKLIELRKETGIEYDSSRTTLLANSSCYAAKIDGTNGSIIVMIGSGYTSSDPSFTSFYSGNNFAIWTNNGITTCSTPVISLSGGGSSFSGEYADVTITCSTDGADVYYTTDGTVPSSSNGELYTGAIRITGTTTIKAIAVKDGSDDSSVASASFTKIQNVTWHFYNSSSWGTPLYAYAWIDEDNRNSDWPGLGMTSEGDGWYSWTGSNAYLNIIFNNNQGDSYKTADLTVDLDKLWYKNGWYSSKYAAEHASENMPAPQISGTTPFVNSVTVTITSEVPGAVIYYTTDGSEPSVNSTRYTTVFTLSESATVKAIATYGTMTDSAVSEKEFTKRTTASPVISGTTSFTSTSSAVITCATEDAVIYYTTDGTDPTSASSEYDGEIEITDTTTIKAIAVCSGYYDSEVVSVVFTKTALPTVSTPQISGTTPFDGTTEVTITCGTVGASIYYTTNGSTPTTSSSLYSAAFTVSSSCTVKAFAVLTDYEDSGVAEMTFTKMAVLSAPVISASGLNENTQNFYDSATVTITADEGATIYYTTDGTTIPTKESAVYSSGIVITSTTTVKAIAIKSGFVNSAVTSETYEKVARTVTFYFKAPTWVNGGVDLYLDGNGHSWDGTTMTACSTAQWYKCTVEVTSFTSEITYQPRMKENGVIKYMHKPGSSYDNSNATIIPSTGFVVIDATGTLSWSGNDFCVSSGSVSTPSSDPAY